MRPITLIALSAVLSGTVAAQITLRDDFDTGPVGQTGGRDGWRHNSERFDRYLLPPSGDPLSHVSWNTNGVNGWIESRDAAQGSGEYFVAPPKFVVNGGNLLALDSARLRFQMARFQPLVSTSGNGTFQVRIYKGFGYVSTTIDPATTFPDFFSTNSVWRDFEIDLKDLTIWTPNATGEDPVIPTVEEVLSGADRILIGAEVRSGSEINGIDNVELAYETGGQAMSVKSDFDAAPAGADGREGWRHNFNRAIDLFTGIPQGDANSRVYWVDDGVDRFLAILEAAAGQNDMFIAPDRYVVEGGRFDLLDIAQFGFKFRRLYPDTTTWTSSSGADLRLDLRFRIYSGNSYAQFLVSRNDLPTAFYNELGGWYSFAPDVLDRSQWTIGRDGASAPQKTLDEILSSVTHLAVVGEIRSGSEINALDDFSFTYRKGETYSGRVLFDGRETSPPSGFTVEFREPGTTNVLHTRYVPVPPDGRYVIRAVPAGYYDVYAKPKGFLSRRFPNATLSGSLTGVDLLFINGDIDDDNSVTVFDYDKLSTYFDKTSSEPDWSTTDANGIAPKDADLDADGAVTVFDYDILSRNFDLAGE